MAAGESPKAAISSPAQYCGLRLRRGTRIRELPEEHEVLRRWCEALGQEHRGQRLAGLARKIFLKLLKAKREVPGAAERRPCGEVPRVIPYWSQFGAQGNPMRSSLMAKVPRALKFDKFGAKSCKLEKIDKLIFWQKLQGNLSFGSKKGSWALHGVRRGLSAHRGGQPAELVTSDVSAPSGSVFGAKRSKWWSPKSLFFHIGLQMARSALKFARFWSKAGSRRLPCLWSPGLRVQVKSLSIHSSGCLASLTL